MTLAERLTRDEAEVLKNMLKYRNTFHYAMSRLRPLQDSKLLSNTDKLYSSISFASADFYFEPGTAPDEAAALLREFVRVTGVRLEKKFEQSFGQFVARGEIRNGDDIFWVRFSGFTPPTCRIIKEEVIVPAHTETKWRSECDSADGEGPVEPEPEANDAADAATTA